MKLLSFLRELGLPAAERARELPAFPKPGQRRRRREAVKVRPDGREICNLKSRAGRAEYFRRIGQMLELDEGVCCICREPIEEYEIATFQHNAGRGMGGGHRDDRIAGNGAAHAWCNAELGSRRLLPAEGAIDA